MLRPLEPLCQPGRHLATALLSSEGAECPHGQSPGVRVSVHVELTRAHDRVSVMSLVKIWPVVSFLLFSMGLL